MAGRVIGPGASPAPAAGTSPRRAPRCAECGGDATDGYTVTEYGGRRGPRGGLPPRPRWVRVRYCVPCHEDRVRRDGRGGAYLMIDGRRVPFGEGSGA